MIRKLAVAGALASLCLVFVSCAGRSSIPPAILPNIAGAWEFQVTSNSNTATYTGIETALKEGQTIVDGQPQPNGQVSATGPTQINIVTIDPTNLTVLFGGSCPITGSGTYDFTGSISELGGPFNFTYTENGNLFNVTGSISSDGKSYLGTYTSSSDACVDSGSIVGTAVAKISGVYVGEFVLPDTTYSVTTTLSENSSNVLSASIIATSPSALNLTLSGPVTGNSFTLQGTYQGQTVTYAGYYGLQVPNGSSTVTGIYFQNMTNSSQPVYAGTLTLQPPVN